MKFFGIESAALALGLAGLAQAHMEMTDPAPFKSKANPHANGDVDYSMTAPLEAGGGNFPCKGYHSLFGTPAGASVADWKAGGSYSMTITGGANHGGGSCQASLSFDKGETWKVIHSYIGNCPGAGTTSYDFKVPADTPSGEAIFAWTWFNQIGNREMYMNCAAVTIGGGSSSKKRASALSSRPSMFVANVNNGCSTEEGSDLEFPDPGSDVSNDSSKTAPPKGSCASGSGSGSGGGSSGGDSGATPSSPAGGDGSGNGNNGAAPSSPAGGDTGAPSSAAPISAPSMTQPAAEPSQPAAEPSQPAVESSAAGGAPSQVPGGVFITVSSPAEGTEAPVAAPTDTMMTLTKSAPGTGNEPMPTSVVQPSAVQPEPVPTTPAGTPEAAPTAAPATPSSGSGDGGADSGSGSGEGHAAGTACTTEGEWNCIGGSKYQRCASGRWSVVQSMASGTTCSGSKTMAFAWGFGRKLALRARRA